MTTKAFFTVGVVVESTKPFTSKSNKLFSTVKISDLWKYEMFRARKLLEKNYKDDKDGLKMAEKSFNSNGYKVMKIMIFNEAAHKVSKINIGSVVAVLNPKALKPSVEYGHSYCADTDA